MTAPLLVSGRGTIKWELLKDKFLTRRIAVREERSARWRTRGVDDFSFSDINRACEPQGATMPQGVEFFTAMFLFLLRYKVVPKLWKRDIKRAYRSLPVFSEHLVFIWVIWMCDCEYWIAQHCANPFGPIAAVRAWHRFANLYNDFAVKVFKAPMGRTLYA